METPPLNVAEYARAARAKLPKEVYDYYEGGALDEITLRENTAGAAKAARTLFILSSLSNTAMEPALAEAASPRWFQLYIYKDRGITADLVKRAEAAGAEAIVLTVDAPGLGTRERDMRNRFTLPEGLCVENLSPLGKGRMPEVRGSGLAAYVRDNFKSDLSFEDLDWLCGCSRLPIVVKGVCRSDDARRVAEHGAKAIVVSNHGGRQLDTAPATCEMLPHIVEAVDDRCEIYVDGGIRRGSDALKAIALGARAVLVGRPILWGLTVAGQEGVLSVLEILRRELDEAMLLCGSTNLKEINRSLLSP